MLTAAKQVIASVGLFRFYMDSHVGDFGVCCEDSVVADGGSPNDDGDNTVMLVIMAILVVMIMVFLVMLVLLLVIIEVVVMVVLLVMVMKVL